MSAQDGFQILARAPGRDAKELGRVGTRLGKTFAVAVQQEALQSGGVLVYQAGNIDEAQSVAERVRELGADAVIVDPEGQVIGVKEVELSFLASEQEARSSTAPSTPPPAAQDKTLMGGWGDQGSAAVDEGDAVDIGYAQTMFGPGQQSSAPTEPAAEGPGVDDTAPSEPEQAAEPDGGPAQAETIMGLDSLDADSLVMLDGSQEEEEEEAPARGDPSLDLEEPISSAKTADDFAPPADDEILELDNDSQTHQLGVAAVDHETFTVAEAGEPEVASDDTAGEMDYIPADEAEAAEPSPGPPPPEQPAGPRSSGQMTATSRAALRTALRQKHTPLHFLSDLFRERPRLRIVIGFVLALGLGSIVPTCYAQSVVKESFHPLLVDLSTAKAHGQLLRGQPNYRTPEDIEDQISSMQTRYGFYSFFFWLVIGGGVGFAWFRFTRP